MSELQTKDAVMNTKNDGSSQYSQTCIVGYLVAWICNSHTPEARIIQRNQASSPRTQVPWTLCLGQLKEQSQPFRVLLSVRKGFAVGLNLVPNTNCYSRLKRICSWVKATVWKSEVPGLGRAWQGREGQDGAGPGRLPSGWERALARGPPCWHSDLQPLAFLRNILLLDKTASLQQLVLATWAETQAETSNSSSSASESVFT